MDKDRLRGALSREDMANEMDFKRAENRIAEAKGEKLSVGARWMLRRLRMRLFATPKDQKPPKPNG